MCSAAARSGRLIAGSLALASAPIAAQTLPPVVNAPAPATISAPVPAPATAPTVAAPKSIVVIKPAETGPQRIAKPIDPIVPPLKRIAPRAVTATKAGSAPPKSGVRATRAINRPTAATAIANAPLAPNPALSGRSALGAALPTACKAGQQWSTTANACIRAIAGVTKTAAKRTAGKLIRAAAPPPKRP